jgi:hypothetical protein
LANFEVTKLRKLVCGPQGKAKRVAIVAAAALRRTIEIAVKVHLFARIIIVDIFAIPIKAVIRVLNAEYSTSIGVFCYADRIVQTPAEADTIINVAIGLRIGRTVTER